MALLLGNTSDEMAVDGGDGSSGDVLRRGSNKWSYMMKENEILSVLEVGEAIGSEEDQDHKPEDSIGDRIHIVEQALIIAWSIYSRRNRVLFQNEPSNPLVSVFQALETMEDITYLRKDKNNQIIDRLLYCQPDRSNSYDQGTDYIKINISASKADGGKGCHWMAASKINDTINSTADFIGWKKTSILEIHLRCLRCLLECIKERNMEKITINIPNARVIDMIYA
ncbi:uncharacterized protein G2W53_026403 [Senna tora]|uniref:Uncharacterized protein n=1 Tax=Senna tora TaxID=362788 RepID=A0A834TEZ2_9FABA|nr:uncharacterized protein G2W53_026403 [Senna tora]